MSGQLSLFPASIELTDRGRHVRQIPLSARSLALDVWEVYRDFGGSPVSPEAWRRRYRRERSRKTGERAWQRFMRRLASSDYAVERVEVSNLDGYPCLGVRVSRAAFEAASELLDRAERAQAAERARKAAAS